MRKLLLSMAAAVAVAGALMMPTSASAAPVSPPGFQPAIIDSTMVQDVQWRCWHGGYSRRFCRGYGGYGGYGGHGWRRSHWWRGSGYGYYRYRRW